MLVTSRHSSSSHCVSTYPHHQKSARCVVACQVYCMGVQAHCQTTLPNAHSKGCPVLPASASPLLLLFFFYKSSFFLIIVNPSRSGKITFSTLLSVATKSLKCKIPCVWRSLSRTCSSVTCPPHKVLSAKI